MDALSKLNVTHHFEKRALLALINSVAGLSIFFFGYDQGLMGGVVTNRDYAETMGFGYWDATQNQVQVTRPLLKGGIVGSSSSCRAESSSPLAERRVLLAGNSRWCFPWRLDW